MHADSRTLFELENKFWQSIVEEDTLTATGLLTEPAFMVSSHGTLTFDHAAYRRMAEQGSMVVKSYELSDMNAAFPGADTAILTYKVKQVLRPRGKSEEVAQEMTDTSTWVRDRGVWKCAMHTESPATHTHA
ncbi:MAG TPA: nuclear transport factor 2 family protein [Burkholderiaceae bacterium]|nr:nuclear transport factor 2 family protein [Burkholderiaceae bacterium]